MDTVLSGIALIVALAALAAALRRKTGPAVS